MYKDVITKEFFYSSTYRSPLTKFHVIVRSQGNHNDCTLILTELKKKKKKGNKLLWLYSKFTI